jgi:hypothetical protein
MIVLAYLRSHCTKLHVAVRTCSFLRPFILMRWIGQRVCIKFCENSPHSPCFSLFPLLKIKLKCRNFDTTEVIEADLQAVLNSHRTRHSGCISKMAKWLRAVLTLGMGLFRWWRWPVGPKLVFWPDDSISPGNYGWFFVCYDMCVDG